MKFQKRWYSLALTACCFCLMLMVFSSTALAADTGDTVSFAEAYGLEIADGSYVEVTFKFPDSKVTIQVFKDDSMEDVADNLDDAVSFFGYTIYYDRVSGQLVAKYHDEEIVELKVFLDDKELTLKPSVSGPAKPTVPASPTMSELLATISTVLTVSLGWMSMVANKVMSNPILLIVVILGFLSTGILLFKRFLNL